MFQTNIDCSCIKLNKVIKIFDTDEVLLWTYEFIIKHINMNDSYIYLIVPALLDFTFCLVWFYRL